MTFSMALKASYRSGTAFLFACPALALVPVVFEMLQHIAEMHIDLYTSIAAAKSLEHHPLRMVFGMAKVLSLIVPGYWIIRYLAWGRVALADRRSITLFTGVVAFQLVWVAIQLFVLPRTLAATLTGFLVGQIVAGLLPAWGVAAALGNPDVGPGRSARIMAPQLAWTFALQLVAVVPLMIPHYILGTLALMGPRVLVWPLLVLDALLVGWLCAVMVASSYQAAVRAAARASVTLSPD